jgi:hypothetical protein
VQEDLYMGWTRFDLLWPWIGLGAAVVLLVILFATGVLRREPQRSRWRDVVWLSWLAVPIYMIHQFEEYGIDLLGVRHAFPDGLCNQLGLGDYPGCPIPHDFYLYVNIPLVWVAGVIAATLCRRNPFVGLGLYSVIISNGMVHIMTAIVQQRYNPGVFTAVILFLPSFFWLCKACFGKTGLARKGIGVLIATGVLLHIILISSVLLYVGKHISGAVLDGVQTVNASMIILIPWLGERLLAFGLRKG